VDIVKELDRLADLKDELAARHAAKDLARKEVLVKVQTELDTLDFAYADPIAALLSEADTLEAEIKDAVLTLGKSVKATRLQMAWAKGRVSWDTKGIEGLAKVYPVLLDFRKEGPPSVSLRAVK